MDKRYFLEKLRALDAAGKSTAELYRDISELAMEAARENWKPCTARAAYYLSMEFLVGRSFYNDLMELGVLPEVREILAAKGVDIGVFEEIEDAALGNGGLGRLAACFLDSAAGLGLPLYGYGIRYRYGLFRQAFVNGYQTELPDDWQRFGDPWSVRREEEKRVVHFADLDAVAVPYDMPVFGKRVNTLRLFQAEGSPEAEQISAYLYPADDTEEGRVLRLRQEYFFSAAAVGELVERYVARHGTDLAGFPRYHAIQLNDTHPVLAAAEFLRLLTDVYGVPFARAVDIAGKTFYYTNHTILPEALERWPKKTVERILPDIAAVLVRLSRLQRRRQRAMGCSEAEISSMAILRDGVFFMANVAVFVAGAVNGVARIHTEILKNRLFADAYRYYPQKFQNKTNGVTQRRWLMLCNEELSSLLDDRIGTAWREDVSKLSDLNGCVSASAEDFIRVKGEKKRQLFRYIESREGVRVPDHFLVLAQVKRLHEYKRQLMTAFAVLELYYGLKEGRVKDFYPTLFLFGAKSAPSYTRAKGIIKYVNEIAALVNADEETNGLLRVVFVQNYNVSYAEKIVAGADVSLQVSTAGLEASGTGNMKFMLNGAVTCGTMDGANIEIVERAGRENNYIFGAEVDEIEALRRGGYRPERILKESPEHARALRTLTDGTFSDDGKGWFQELYDSLTVGTSWHEPDHYFILRDLGPYVEALLRVNRDYGDRKAFAVKQLYNVANAAYFSSDRTIREYAEDIWKIGGPKG